MASLGNQQLYRHNFIPCNFYMAENAGKSVSKKIATLWCC